MAYATVTELNDHLGRTPANAEQLLTRASRDVDRALLTTVYDATDPVVVAALREATLEQVAANLDAGNVTGFGAVRRGGFSIGRVSVESAPVTPPEGGPVRIGTLWEQAWMVLQAAGLTGHGPQSR
ncbi:hypothetical protein AB0A95_30870 [Micromonospora sp. NPDC049230]|uniref:hypothetical protein n=1 Tax=Micromonospora sp. NPDC049230 TaxID=3155502 RepID=UPI0033FFE007